MPTAAPRSPALLLLATTLFAGCYVGPGNDPSDSSFHADPDTIDFGYVAATEFSEFREIELVNNTTVDVSIEAIRLSEDSDNAFTLGTIPATMPSTVNAGDTEVIGVAFAPPTSGEFLGTIEVLTDHSTDDLILIALGGCSTDADCTVEVGDDDDATGDDDDDDDTGDDDDSTTSGDGDISISPVSIDFGDVPQNQNPPGDVVQISNTGGGPLVVSSIDITGGDAALFIAGGYAGGTLQPGGAPANLNVTFNAAGAALGPKSATLVITSDDADEGTTNIALTANVTEPCNGGAELNVVGGTATANPLGSPPNLIYIALAMGAQTDVTIENAGCDVLTVTAIADDSGTIVGPNADITIASQDPLPWALAGGESSVVTFQVGTTGGCDVINVNGAYGFTVGTEADITACLGGFP